MLQHFANMPTRLFTTKTSGLQPLGMSYSWTSLLSSSAPKLEHVLITWTRVNLSGFIPSRCICRKSCITFSGCHPSHILQASYSLQKCSIALCLVPLQSSADQADHTCILHTPDTSDIIRTEKAAPTFSISERILSQHIASTYLLQPATIIAQVQRIWKAFLPKSRP